MLGWSAPVKRKPRWLALPAALADTHNRPGWRLRLLAAHITTEIIIIVTMPSGPEAWLTFKETTRRQARRGYVSATDGHAVQPYSVMHKQHVAGGDHASPATDVADAAGATARATNLQSCKDWQYAACSIAHLTPICVISLFVLLCS